MGIGIGAGECSGYVTRVCADVEDVVEMTIDVLQKISICCTGPIGSSLGLTSNRSDKRMATSSFR